MDREIYYKRNTTNIVVFVVLEIKDMDSINLLKFKVYDFA